MGDGGGRSPVSVLVVDDDSDIREVVEMALTEHGYTVASAGNGAEALEALARFAPDVILLDLMMPVMDGRDFREAQRRDARYAAVPTIIMSATDRVQAQLPDLAPAAYLPKPIALRTLLDVVAKFSAPHT